MSALIGRTRKAKAFKHSQLTYLYRIERQWFGAQQAMRNARIRQAWERVEYPMDGEPTFGIEPKIGNVRLSIQPECDEYQHGDYDNERQRQEVIDRLNRDGLWTVVGEYFDGEDWQHADSCGGFIGDDWKHSGYDVDIMEATMEAARKVAVCQCCGRPKRKAIA